LAGVILVLGGCLGLTPTAVAQCLLPPPVILTNSPVCESRPLTFSATGVPAGATYHWTGPNGFNRNNPSPVLVNPTPADAGYYRLTVELNNCFGTDSVLVVVNARPVVTITASGPLTICRGDSLTLTASGADTYQWSTGATTPSITVRNNGNYSVVGTSAAGCTAANQAVTVAVTPRPTVTISVGGPTALCDGDSVTLTAQGAQTYLWSTGATTPAIRVRTSGTYSVTGTSVAGCTGTSSPVTITVSPRPIVTISASGPTSFCSGGSVVLTAQGAATYRWSTGAITPSITVTQAGVFTVTGTTAAGCAATSAAVTVFVGNTPAAPTAVGAERCGPGTLTLTASGAGAASTYHWYAQANGGAILATGATFTTPLLTATANYFVTSVSAAGCESARVPVRARIKEIPNVAIAATGATTFCEGGSVRLIATGAANYVWSTGATTPSITVTTAGSYTVTGTNAAGCTATSAPLVVTVNPSPVVTISANGPTTFCQGDSVRLTATGAAAYFWSNGARTPSIRVTTSGSYFVTGTTTSGCATVSAPIAVNVNPGPGATVTADGPLSFCQGDSVRLTVVTAPNTSIRWSTGANTPSITVGTSGTYTVTTTNNATSCRSTSAPQVVTVNPLPTVSITHSGPTTFCQGGSIVLTATGATTYRWSTGATTPSIVVTAAGAYTVTGTTGTGCTATSAPLVITTQPVALAPAASGGTHCGPGTVSLTASGAGANETYQWYAQVSGGTAVATGNTFTTPTLSATTTYYVAIVNAAGCESPRTAAVATINALPTVTVAATGPTTFCKGGSVTLTATATAGTTLLWNTGATTPSITVDSAGVYTVTATAATGCSTTSAGLIVTVNPLASATFSYPLATYCLSAPQPLPTITGTSGGTFSVSPNVGLSLNPITGEIDLSVSNTGTYIVTYSVGGTCPASATASITVTTAPVATFSYSAPTFCGGASAGTAAPLYPGGASAGAFTAIPAGLTLNGATGEIDLATSQPGSYTVTNTIAANAQCGATAATTTVSIQAAPVVRVTASGPTTFCAGGSVTLTASGAAAYQWSNGATSASITVSTSGTYSVTGTNAATCVSEAVGTVVTVTPQASATFTYPAATYCLNAGTDPLPTITGTAGGTFSATPAGLSLNATTGEINLAGSAPGTYVLTYAVGGTCPAQQTASITLNVAAQAAFAYAQPSYCAGASGSIAALLAPGSTAGTFSATPAGLTVNATTGEIALATSAPGSYTVTNSLAASGACGAVTATTTVVLEAAPTATIAASGPTTFCAGDSVTLTASVSAGAPLLWNTGATTPSITVSATGTYSVTATNATGCTTTATRSVTAEAAPATPTITQSGSGAPITLTSSATSGNQWYLNGQPIVGATAQTYVVTSSSQNGVYTVMTMSPIGCASAASAPLTVVITGIGAELTAPTLDVYPNPTPDGRLTVTAHGFRQPLTLTVLDALGRAVLTQPLATDATAPLDLSTLPVGVYTLRAQTGTSVLTRRLVRQ
jgi:large repetitive protein